MDIRKALSSFVEFVLSLGANPKDNQREALRKRFLIALGSLMAIGGIPWGALCFAFGLYLPAIVPLSYTVLTVVNLAYFHKTKRFAGCRFRQVLMSLLLPFLLQYMLGGFYPSGAVMYWALLSVLGSFAFSESQKTFTWVFFFVGFTLLGAFLEPLISAHTYGHQIPNEARPWLFALNMSVISTLTFFLVRYFVRLQESSYEKLREAEMLISHASRIASISEMASGLGHEINNPLAIILGRTTLLKKAISDGSLDSAALLAQLNIIQNNSKRIAEIIRSLNPLGTSSDKDPFLEVKLSKLISDALVLCEQIFIQRRVSVQVETFADLAVRVRPGQVLQVLLNLLSNAYDAIQSEEVKWIRIDVTSSNKNRVRVSVTDSGSGIPKEIAEKMMQPFFTTKPVGKGAGLGLCIANKIAEGQGGSLTYDKTSPNTKFILELQIASTTEVAVA